MITSKEILNLVTQYEKTQDLGAFAASFAEVFYDIENTGDPGAIQLAYEIEAALAAVTAGMCSEAGLPAVLKSLSPTLTVVIAPNAEPTSQEVAPYGVFMRFGAAVGTGKLVHVGISPSVGFGSTTVIPNTHQTSTDLPQWQQVKPA